MLELVHGNERPSCNANAAVPVLSGDGDRLHVAEQALVEIADYQHRAIVIGGARYVELPEALLVQCIAALALVCLGRRELNVRTVDELGKPPAP